MTIYVIRSDNLVKIGFSDDIRVRVRSIIASVPVPVEFAGHMPGDREVERHLHQRFAEARFSGEWFVETDQMRACFDALLIPGLPDAETPKHRRRRANEAAVWMLSQRIKDEAAKRWPGASKGERLKAFAETLGWNPSRARDVYYGDRRVIVRAEEMQELERFLSGASVVGAGIEG